MAKDEKPPEVKRPEQPESVSSSVFRALQGEWQVVYSELNGEMTPLNEKIILRHQGNNFTVSKNGKVAYEGTFAINVRPMPHQVVLIFKKSAFEPYLAAPRVGIALLEGDTLKTVFGPAGLPLETQTGFQSFRDSDTVMTIHQRVGAERGTGMTTSASRTVAGW